MERQRVPVHSENSENSETLADQQESNDMIPQHSWNVALDIKNLSIGMPSVLQTLTEGMMSIYWLMALRAIDTANAMVLQRLEPILIKFRLTPSKASSRAAADPHQPPSAGRSRGWASFRAQKRPEPNPI